MKSVNVSLPDPILKELDEAIKKYGFGTRTEFIRDAIRSKIAYLESRHSPSKKEAGGDVFEELKKRFM